MNEFTKDRPTAEQLVEKLDNELEMTICSDVVHGLDYEYKQLQQENQELKKQKEEWIDLLNMFKTQQKEFIEWLESKNFLGQIPVEQVLSKYKEITGDKE